ncbi:MAG: glycosyltransferase family 4 protein [Acidobacteriaceae bacterium]|jgi:glycosyltransferase involved in cell wall biosynthesis
MKVLLSAYACIPNRGTEPGHGWGLAVHLAKLGIEVHVLTTLANSEMINDHIRDYPVPGISFHYVDYPTRRFRSEEMRYLLWQWAAVKSAKALNQSERFDVVHHITFGSVHVPSQLWRIGVPTVFGPVGGGQTAPESMLRYFGSDKKKERARTLLTRAIKYSPFHRYWLSKMSFVLVTNRETYDLVRFLGRKDAEMMFDVIIPNDFVSQRPRRFEDTPRPLKILWVGTMRPRKGLALSLDILAKVKTPATLTILGNGFEERGVREMIARRKLTDRVIWEDRRLPWAEVKKAYLTHDVMLFNSLRETGGAQLAESMALGLPVVTLNMHGPAELVPEGAGLKIEVHNPEQVIQEAAAALDRFANLSGEERSRMSQAGWSFARSLTYSNRAKQMAAIYESAIARRQTASSMLHASARIRYGTGE